MEGLLLLGGGGPHTVCMNFYPPGTFFNVTPPLPPCNTNTNRVAHGLVQMDLVATMWVPMGAQVPLLSPNDHPNPS